MGSLLQLSNLVLAVCALAFVSASRLLITALWATAEIMDAPALTLQAAAEAGRVRPSRSFSSEEQMGPAEISKSPEAVIIEATNKCNLACKMCPVPTMRRSRGFLSTGSLAAIMESLPEGTRVGLANWGEPMLHPGLSHLVGMLTAQGLIPEVTTNGLLLTKSLLERLMQAGLQRVFISIDGLHKVYESTRGVSYALLEDRLQDVLAARMNGLEVHIRMTVYKDNQEGYRAVREAMRGMVDGFSVQRQIIWDGPSRTEPCPAIYKYITFLWDGTAVACCGDPEGVMSLGRGSAMEIWNGARLQALRDAHQAGRFPKLCQHCTEWAGGPSEVGHRFQPSDSWSI